DRESGTERRGSRCLEALNEARDPSHLLSAPAGAAGALSCCLLPCPTAQRSLASRNSILEGPRMIARCRLLTPFGLLLISGMLHAQELPTIRRTEYGVPHILANDYRGIGIGLGYAQVEDYGDRVILGVLRAKGVMGLTFGRDSMQSDFAARRDLRRVEETYHLLDAETRGVYEGFAEGLNIYIRTHPERVPAWARPVFHGHDIAALDIGNVGTAAAQRIAMRQSLQSTGAQDDL